ncbi:FKBP-type peptidyl-prolyl cis-trans isomerase [Crocinitomicaceae bacterium]|nr:FKBP-type peptidyl-prolyl cis-trans isomerase [Crocinitomicaceae bacterium]
MKYLMGIIILFALISCDLIERDSSEEDLKDRFVMDKTKRIVSDTVSVSKTMDSVLLDTLPNKTQIYAKDTLMTILDFEKEIQYVDELVLSSGVRIKWIERKRGRKLLDGELILIEYRLGLPDGKTIDGNNKMKMPNLPFVIGYNMQNRGWDLGLSELCVGDEAKIEIPSDLAYGKKGLETVIPPNTDNWLFVKIHGLVSPDFNEGGVRYWELRSGVENSTSSSKIKFHMIASTKNKANIFNTPLSNVPLTYVSGQNNYPKGLEQVLKKAKKGQHLFLVLDPNMAYGDKGYLDLVKPNESVFYNLKILQSE